MSDKPTRDDVLRRMLKTPPTPHKPIGKRTVVTVHHFRVWDHARGDFVIQPLKSPEDRIQRIGGEIIPGTAEDVDASDLDAEGRYDPMPRDDPEALIEWGKRNVQNGKN